MTQRRTYSLFPWLLGACLLTGALALGGGRPDPLPLRRIEIGPERVAAELELAQKGTLVLMPRAEFEAKVQQAALAVELTATPPRLIKAHYKALLSQNALVGEAQWSVVHTAAGPGMLPLSDLNLALSSPATVDGGPAVLGELDGKSPALLIEHPGQRTVFFEWNRRGTLIGNELHFDLQLPACATATLDLKLPEDYRPVASHPGVLVEGPHGADDSRLCQWSLSFSGRSRVDLVLRRLATESTVLMASTRTRQEISNDRVLADFEFKIEALHGSVSRLIFLGDALLQPYEVTIGGVDVKDWQWRTGSGEGQSVESGILELPLGQPLTGALPAVAVRCLAPVVKDQKNRSWLSPSLEPRGALLRGETLQLRTHPETQLEGLESGDFHLTRSSTDQDGSQTLTLVQGGRSVDAQEAEGTPVRRPSAVLKSRNAELVVNQQSWWQIDTQSSTLTSELDCKATSGQTYHLPLKLPADSLVNMVQVEPKEMLRSWAAAGSQKNPLLLVDLAQPTKPGQHVKITVQLRLPLPPLAAKGPTLPLPDVEPPPRSLREGTLAVSVHPRWQGRLLKSSVQATAPPGGPGLWRQALVDYYFSFRGTALTGQLRLNPRPAQFQVRCQSDALIGANRGTLLTRLTIEPTSGSVDYVDLEVSAELAEAWKARNESTGAAPRLVSVSRLSGLDPLAGLLVLGARSGLEAAPALAAEPGVQRWRLRFAEAVRDRVQLVLEAPFDPLEFGRGAQPGEDRLWAVPVVTAVGAGQFDGELAVQLMGADITTAQPNQLQEVARQPGKTSLQPGVQHVWRVYRYDGAAVAQRRPGLFVLAHSLAGELAARERCDKASLTTYVEKDGRLLHHYHFHLVNWRRNEVPVQLPADAVMLAGRTAGRWLAVLTPKVHHDGVQINLPASAGLAEQDFDVYYRTPNPTSDWCLWDTLQTTAPQLPVRPLNARHHWVLPPGLVPIDQSWQCVDDIDQGKAGDFSLRPKAKAPQPALAGMLPDSFGPEWKEWARVATVRPPTEIAVVRVTLARGCGIFLGALVGITGGMALLRCRSPRGRMWLARLLVLGAAGGWALVWWLPVSLGEVAAWPAATAVLLVVCWLVGSALRRKALPAGTLTNRVAASGASVAIFMVLAVVAISLPFGWSQGVDNSIVLLLPGPPEAPDRQDVLVTPDLLKRLATLAQRGPSGLRGAMLLAANYEGQVTGDVALIQAEFVCHSFDDKSTLTIPLTGVELRQGALLDGHAVLPTAAPGGYAVAVSGVGRHRLTLPFALRLQTKAEHRDLRITAPRLFQNRWTLRVPADWPAAQILSGVGQAQTSAGDGQPQELTIDLGRDSALQLRWPLGTRAAALARTSVHEAYFWDWRGPDSTCTAVLNYNVEGPGVDRFIIGLPAGLEPREVEVAGDGIEGDDSSRPQLRHWRLSTSDSPRVMRVQLQGPAAGNVVVTVHLIPRDRLGPHDVRLAMPMPMGGVKSSGGIVGYRIDGYDTSAAASNLTSAPLAAEQFADQWQENGANQAVLPTRGFSFNERPADAALTITLSRRPTVFEQDVHWTLHPGRADLVAAVKAAAMGNELMLVEWEVPAKVVVAEITGDNIRSWTRPAGQARLQVWLNQPAKTASFTIRGWDVIADTAPAAPLRWSMPCLTCLDSGSLQTTVRVTSGGNVRIDPDARKLENLKALPPPATLAWTSQGPYRAEFLVRSMAAPARVTAVTSVEADDGKLWLSSDWEVDVPHGGGTAFQLRVRNWPGRLKLQALGDVTVRELPAPEGQQGWQINVLAGSPRRLHVKVTGTRPYAQVFGPNAARPPFELPLFQLNNAVRNAHWIAVRSPALEVLAATGLTPVMDMATEPGLPPGTLQRLGQQTRLWKATGTDWKLQLLPPATSETAGLHLLRTDQEMAFGEGFGWIHQTNLTVQVQESHELALTMPASAVLLAASVNGEQCSTRYTAPDRLVVTLPGGAGVYGMKLLWALGAPLEPLEQPQLAVPRVEGAQPGVVDWKITVPAGYRPVDDAQVRSSAAGDVAGLDKGLAKDDRPAGSGDKKAAAGLAQSGGLPVGRGTTLRWQAASSDVPQTLTLVAIEHDQVRQACVATFWISLALLSLLIFSFWPRTVAWLTPPAAGS
jgi:hypothetical protein